MTPSGAVICAQLAGPNEFMTITVSVMNSGSDKEVCECGIARAKDFARHFGDLPLQYFPMPVATRPTNP